MFYMGSQIIRVSLLLLLLNSATLRSTEYSERSAHPLYDCVHVNKKHLSHIVDLKLLAHHCRRVKSSLHRYQWTQYASLPKSLVRNDIYAFTVLTESPISSITSYDFVFNYVDNILSASQCDDVACVAHILNRDVWNITEPPIVFKPAPPNELNSYSIEQTITQKNSSCTGLSVLLVAAFRMAGIAARIAGVPHWNLSSEICPNGDSSPKCGNHNWVEIYVPNAGWSFVDQRRPDMVVLPLNVSWFYPDQVRGNSIPLSGNHSVYASSFLSTDDLSDIEASEYPVGGSVISTDHFPMVWDWNNTSIFAWDVSASYGQRSALNQQIMQVDDITIVVTE